MKDFLVNITLPQALFSIIVLVLITIIIVCLVVIIFSPCKKQKQSKVKKEQVKRQAVLKQKIKKTEETKIEEPKPKEDEELDSKYISPLVYDRTRYETALQEKLERERKEELERQARETAQMEMLKNKEFQSHAGYISTLQRFNKKDQLENQLINDGKINKELLTTYLNEKCNSIGEEFQNMSPELKAVILSDILKRKY